jgi:broad-specificity NMP kinase
MEDGHIFFLKASKESLKERLARRGAKNSGRGKSPFDSKSLIRQEKELMKIYRLQPKDAIDTTDSTAGETAKSIARTILLDKYEPFDFASRLEDVIKTQGDL